MQTLINLFLKFCGVPVDRAAHVSGAELTLRHGGALGWMLALGLALGVLAWWSHRRDAGEMLSPGRRRALVALRCGLFALLVLLLLRPVLAFTLETSIRRTLLTLVDASGSMKIGDLRLDKSDQERVLIATGQLGGRKGLGQPVGVLAPELKTMPRIAVAKAALGNGDLAIYERFRKEFELATFTFGAGLREMVDGLDAVDPAAPATALGDAVRDLLLQTRGQPVAGIFLITDGASNAGSAPLEAARLALAEGVPLYIYGVGITSPRDLIVEKARVTLRLGEEVVAMNEALLRQMADASGGAFFREENLHALPDAIRAKNERVRSTVVAELWSSPLYFLLLAAVASTEWALRKRWQLK